MACADANRLIGESIYCRIQQAACSYAATVEGSPTFCNDAANPANGFTLVVYGSDWTDLDGKCLIVSGLVTLYHGSPQIEATSRSQASECQ